MTNKLLITDLTYESSLDLAARRAIRGGLAESFLFSGSPASSSVYNQYFDVDQTFVDNLNVIDTVNVIDSLTLYDQSVTQNLVSIVDITAIGSQVAASSNQGQNGSNLLL